MGALEYFAHEHGSWFPNQGNGPVQCLQALYPNLEPELAGISGNREETMRRLRDGQPIDESVSSWIYFPGLRLDDDPSVALIWESKSGVGINGRRREGHAVGFVDGSFKQISSSQWSDFIRSQQKLREAILNHRQMENPAKFDTNAPSGGFGDETL